MRTKANARRAAEIMAMYRAGEITSAQAVRMQKQNRVRNG